MTTLSLKELKTHPLWTDEERERLLAIAEAATAYFAEHDNQFGTLNAERAAFDALRASLKDIEP